jgi:hypothetical protein
MTGSVRFKQFLTLQAVRNHYRRNPDQFAGLQVLETSLGLTDAHFVFVHRNLESHLKHLNNNAVSEDYLFRRWQDTLIAAQDLAEHRIDKFEFINRLQSPYPSVVVNNLHHLITAYLIKGHPPVGEEGVLDIYYDCKEKIAITENFLAGCNLTPRGSRFRFLLFAVIDATGRIRERHRVSYLNLLLDLDEEEIVNWIKLKEQMGGSST